MMQYKGFSAAVSFDDEAGVFQGEVVDTRDVIVFEGDSVAQLERAFHFSIEDYLAVCAERGREPHQPLGAHPAAGNAGDA